MEDRRYAMKLTVRTLKKHGACVEAVDWVKGQKDISYKALFTACLTEDHLNWANWMLARLLNKENKVRYAVYAAERVIKIYEDMFPDDDRPRKAIQAAKKYLKNPSQKTAADAAYATADAANAANAAYAADGNRKELLIKILKYGYGLLIKQ